MIGPKEIKEKALRKYNDYLRSIVLKDNSFFPLDIKGDKKNSRDAALTIQQQVILFQNDKSALGYGFSIQAEKRGAQNIIQRIYFDTEEDYLQFTGKTSEVNRFKKHLFETIAEFHQLETLFAEKPQLLVDNLDGWTDIIKVCRYFKQTPAPGIYIRQIPAQVHTKFIERNTQLLFTLLSIIAPNHIAEGKTFEERLQLKSKHNLIRIRFLDEKLCILPGHKELGIAESEINKTPVYCKRVFIIENDITALTFPEVENSIVIFGQGFKAATLKQIDWLRQAQIFYWGDIDAHGFEVLAKVKSAFPQTESFLMDEETFTRFWDKEQPGPALEKTPEHLNRAELTLYKFLCERLARLEQESIPQWWVEQKLKTLLSQNSNSNSI